MNNSTGLMAKTYLENLVTFLRHLREKVFSKQLWETSAKYPFTYLCRGKNSIPATSPKNLSFI